MNHSVNIIARGFDYWPETRQKHQAQIAAAFSRFAKRISSVVVRLVDVNGPRGGRDMHCTLEVRLSGGEPLIIRSLEATPCKAVARAARRGSHTLSRRLKRQRRVAYGV